VGHVIAILLLVFLSITQDSGVRQFRDDTEFVFARLQYPGLLDDTSIKNWYTDYPVADKHTAALINRMTRIHTDTRLVQLDETIYRYPFLYVVEPEQMNLSETQVLLLREWLARGGFLWLDDFHGDYEMQTVQNVLARILPGSEILELWPQHPLFHCFFRIDKIERVLNDQLAMCTGCEKWENGPSGETPKVFAIFDKSGNISVLMVWNSDTGDGLEFADNPKYPIDMAMFAARLMTNIVVYATTH